MRKLTQIRPPHQSFHPTDLIDLSTSESLDFHSASLASISSTPPAPTAPSATSTTSTPQRRSLRTKASARWATRSKRQESNSSCPWHGRRARGPRMARIERSGQGDGQGGMGHCFQHRRLRLSMNWDHISLHNPSASTSLATTHHPPPPGAPEMSLGARRRRVGNPQGGEGLQSAPRPDRPPACVSAAAAAAPRRHCSTATRESQQAAQKEGKGHQPRTSRTSCFPCKSPQSDTAQRLEHTVA